MMAGKRTAEDLRQMQALPLGAKIQATEQRITEWINEFGTDGVYLSFSGGKDSTVLLHIIRNMERRTSEMMQKIGFDSEINHIPAVFVDTGLEYPEIRMFAKERADVVLRPKMRFDEVIKKYGYPMIGKRQADTINGAANGIKNKKYNGRLKLMGIDEEQAKQMGLAMPSDEMLERYKKRITASSKFNIEKYQPLLDVDFKISQLCCNVMKKSPMHEYVKKTGRVPIIATMADESTLRRDLWMRTGCNSFDSKEPQSKPLSFWREQDVYEYIKKYNVEICSVYGNVVYKNDPDQMRWSDFAPEYEETEESGALCTTGCDRTGCIFCGFGAHLEKGETRFQRLKRTHPRQYAFCMGGGEYNDHGIWQPSKAGLGMKHVFDEMNAIYGDDFIKYE